VKHVESPKVAGVSLARRQAKGNSMGEIMPKSNIRARGRAHLSRVRVRRLKGGLSKSARKVHVTEFAGKIKNLMNGTYAVRDRENAR
jgi:hypothetical protein